MVERIAEGDGRESQKGSGQGLGVRGQNAEVRSFEWLVAKSRILVLTSSFYLLNLIHSLF
jgi:hypothetical protein